MPDFRYHPALPSKPTTDGFLQTIELFDGKTPIARSRWHAPAGEAGIVQILDLSVDQRVHRRGHGGQLLREVIAQARKHFATQGVRFRRAWVNVEQKSQVKARAFLTQHGFHHVATIPNLLKRQDVLVYSKGMD
jgi:ribosomal protein S18 acetylase RimI-like enzyme